MTDELPAVRLIALGDSDAAGLCADGVCYLPSATSGDACGAEAAGTSGDACGAEAAGTSGDACGAEAAGTSGDACGAEARDTSGSSVATVPSVLGAHPRPGGEADQLV